MEDMSVTCVRSGLSVALYFIFEAPLNAFSMEVQVVFPHCTMAVSLWALSGWV